jgi:preprotein translocase subunit SecY
MISFDPVEVSNNLKKNGGMIPGVRPGEPTAKYINKILGRITFIGAFFLCIVAGLPMLINCIATIFKYNGHASIAFGGSSLLIVIGVALETGRDIESQLTMRHYKGFLQ